ncbi:MAG: zinc ribbon domain-containing protein, partial [Candidatus Helarchaeota archaeon]
KCGKLGKRVGKLFTCSSCGFQLDSDLNAARNIIVTPNSSTAIRGGGG